MTVSIYKSTNFIFSFISYFTSEIIRYFCIMCTMVLNYQILLSDSWLPSPLLYVLRYAHWTLWLGYPS